MSRTAYAYGIRKAGTDIWFAGFGPAPEYEVRWVTDEEKAVHFSNREMAETQIMLLDRFGDESLTNVDL